MKRGKKTIDSTKTRELARQVRYLTIQEWNNAGNATELVHSSASLHFGIDARQESVIVGLLPP